MFKYEQKRFWVMNEIMQIMVENGFCKDFDEASDKMYEELESGRKNLTQILEEVIERGFQHHVPLTLFHAEMKKNSFNLEACE